MTDSNPKVFEIRLGDSRDSFNITPFLYGDAIHIYPARGNPPFAAEDLLTVARNIDLTGGSNSKYEVTLRTFAPGQIYTGALVLYLSLNDAGIIEKRIYRITNVAAREPASSDPANTELFASTETLFPDHEKGFKGFFPATSAGYSPLTTTHRQISQDGLYLLYFYKGGQNEVLPRHRPPNFFERMMETRAKLGCLVQCWSIAHAEPGRLGNYLSLEPFVGFWIRGFTDLHGKAYHHALVWDILDMIGAYSSLRGISKIFDDRNPFQTLDLISPLIERMQLDVLERMLVDDGLYSRLFPKDASQYWKDRLAAITQLYFTPRYVEVVKGGTFKPPIPTPLTLNGNKVRKLKAIVALAEGGLTEDERDTACHIYERLTGMEYDKTSFEYLLLHTADIP